MGIVSYLYSGTRLAENIRSVLVVLGIQKIYNILNMKKLNKHPTPQMFKAREFFSANAKRIETVKNMFADEESKTVFTKLIHMRQYYDTKDIPHYNYFNQYFPKDIIQCSKNEVFVDCGAFNGDTVKIFIKHCPDYGSVIAFEPDNENFLKLNRNLKHKHNIHTVKAGVYNHTGYMNFIDGKGGGSTINNQQSTINNPVFLLLLLIVMKNVKRQHLLKWILKEQSFLHYKERNTLLRKINRSLLFLFIIVMKICYVWPNIFIRLSPNTNYI